VQVIFELRRDQAVVRQHVQLAAGREYVISTSDKFLQGSHMILYVADE
jgi:hypothetical protein